MATSLEPGRAAAFPGRRRPPGVSPGDPRQPSPPESLRGPAQRGGAGPPPQAARAAPPPQAARAAGSPQAARAAPPPQAARAAGPSLPEGAPGGWVPPEKAPAGPPGVRLTGAWRTRGTRGRGDVTPAGRAVSPAGAVPAGRTGGVAAGRMRGVAAGAARLTDRRPGGCRPSPTSPSQPGRGRRRARARSADGATPGDRRARAGGVRCRAASGSASSSPARPSAPSRPW
jgi:hypothetical protein